MLHISLFSGIGGFELAAEWMGWQNIVSCEINPFGRKVLEYYWANSYHHDDIKTLNYDTINNELTKRFGAEWRNDDIILTGGFPCQPYSLAGKRKGKDDERHLWPEMLRIIREVKPSWIVGENVLGIVNWNGGLVFHEVQTDLEAEGYEVQPYVLPACAVNAPHRRDRVWFVAYNQHNGNRRREQQQKSEQETNRTSKNTGSNGCSNGEYDKQISKRNEWEFGTGSKERIFVGEALQDASNTGLLGQEKCEKQTAGIEQRNKGNVMHTNGTSKQGKHIGQTREGQFNGPDSRNGFDNFQNFPTQSPICSRNDGLSSRLDGITFSKWRNESIKAAGNAVVPQVVYQIFKAIEVYMSKTSKRTF